MDNPFEAPDIALPLGSNGAEPVWLEVGHLNELRETGSFTRFLDGLYTDFGPLASFYWGPRYVVTIGKWEVLEHLTTYQEHSSQFL